MIRPVALMAIVATAAVAAGPATAACFVRVPASLASDSERSGPSIPAHCKPSAKIRQPKPVDPLKLIRTRMIDGKDVSYDDLRTLADSGDDLAQLHLAKRIETDANPEALATAARYYLLAIENGRDSAVRPLLRLLNAGALDAETRTLASARQLLEDLAGKGDVVARDALIAMYRSGTPFGLAPERADALLTAAAEAGDARAALDLAFALLSGTPSIADTDKARDFLVIAATSETLNVRTMAENLLRTLDPQLTAAAETVS